MVLVIDDKFDRLVKGSLDPLILLPEDSGLDVVGGALGLFLILEKMGKEPQIVSSGSISEKFSFLPESKLVKSDFSVESSYKISFKVGDSRIKELKYEKAGDVLNIYFTAKHEDVDLNSLKHELTGLRSNLVFVVGASDIGALGRIYSENARFFSGTTIVNIDCQKENKNFGDFNFIETSSGSISEILYRIAETMLPGGVDGRIATLFLAGIMAKTDNFQSFDVSPEIFRASGNLLALGAKRNWIIENLYAGKKAEEAIGQVPQEESLVDFPIPPGNVDIEGDLLAEEEVSFSGGEAPAKEENLPAHDAGSFSAKTKGYPPPVKKKSIFYTAIGVLESIVHFIDKVYGFFSARLQKAKPASGAVKDFVSKKRSFILYIAIIIALGFLIFELLNLEFFSTRLANIISTSVLKTIENKLSPPSTVAVDVPKASPSPEAEKPKKAQMAGFPARLRIPRLKIDTSVQQLGMKKNNEMEAPSNITEVGWFKLGPRPGQAGNAVIAGHLDGAFGLPGVFKDLRDLEPGDKVYVEDEYGQILQFQVVRKEIYDAKNIPMDKLFGPGDKARLNLITCDGAWESSRMNYERRLVVFTEQVLE